MEKRINVRRSLATAGEIADALGAHWITIRLNDLSQGGVGFLCAQEIGVGSVRMLRFILPDAPNQPIRAVVKVAYCVKHSLFDGYRLGGQFVGALADEDLARVEVFLR